MSRFIVGDRPLPVNLSTREPTVGCAGRDSDDDRDRAVVAAHQRLTGLDEVGLADLILAETNGLTDDPRLLLVRLAAVRLAGLAAGVER